ncbi:MAG TPA: peptide-methionine (S)-S-oxide reductase MsrA [Vicinamibacterales bacterium]|nr:peptide-methionine (S)-S-oxide reductase MsrA [Vicinamibacterales bacterium]
MSPFRCAAAVACVLRRWPGGAAIAARRRTAVNRLSDPLAASVRFRLAALALAGAIAATGASGRQAGAGQPPPRSTSPAQPSHLRTATFAGGCFWCVEEAFDAVQGVVSTISGYTGGRMRNPTYEEVSSGTTGHVEAVQVTYDPARVSYGRLLEVFWHNIDPTDAGGQFCDRGPQYRSAIFYHDDEQRRLAERSKAELLASGRFRRIATEILPASTFYRAEEYHQDYYRRNPVRYRYYKFGCGRARRLAQIWTRE